MKLIIAGSRGITWYSTFDLNELIIRKFHQTSEVVCGMAKGIDLLGYDWAIEYNVPVKEFPANWKPNGVLDKSAGFKRNTEMAVYADSLLALWDGKSNGTRHMISEMVRLYKPFHVELTQ